MSTPSNSTKPAKIQKPIPPMRNRLRLTWIVWLVYRLLALPILISFFNPTNPNIVGGIAWYGLWLLPAFLVTLSIWQGRSPYMLLVSSMLTLVYLGGSGLILFDRAYGSSWAELAIYIIDFGLLLFVNVWLFILLKRLPSMNKVEK
jgi:hypothetical protein